MPHSRSQPLRTERRRAGSAEDACPGHELAVALRAAYLALHRQTEAWLARWDVTADQFVILAALARGDAATQRELVERAASDPSTLRAMLVLLEGRGLVRRRPHPTDRRARSVKLTARGRRVLTETWSGTEPLRERLTTALFPNEIEELTTSLDRITILLSQGRASASGERNRRPTPIRRQGKKGP